MRGTTLETTGLQARFERHWPRLRASLPSLIRDGALFLALALSAGGADSRTALWLQWWPLPLSILAGVLTLARPERPILRWRHLLWLAFLLGLPAARALLSLAGPLPADGVREARELASIALPAAALWLLGSARPLRALALWTAALAYAGLVALITGGAGLGNPGLFTSAIGILFGVVGILRLHIRHRRLRGMEPWTAHEWSRALHLRKGAESFVWRAAAFIGGCVLGWQWFESQNPASVTDALAIHEALRQQELLWTQSLLFGWGRETLDHLIGVFAGPGPVTLPAWGGVSFLLASGGLAGLGLLIVLMLYLMLWPRTRWGDEADPMAPVAAHWASMPLLMTGGLILTGGPRSQLVMLGLAGWLAMALIRVHRDPPTVRAVPPLSHYAGVTLYLAATVALCGLIGLPTLGSALLRGGGPGLGNPIEYRKRMQRAQRLNPFEPGPLLAAAASWRRTMTDTPGWQESTYLRAFDLYNRAMRLDPYDVAIPLRLAEFHLQADREESAISTIEMALERLPGQPELILWLYNVAVTQQRPTLAYRMLELGQQVSPVRPDWWRQRARLARELGQWPLAHQCLGIALSGALDDPEQAPELVVEAWRAAQPAPAIPPLGGAGAQPG